MVEADGDRALESHFAFGENWRSFLSTLNQAAIDEAVRGLARLFPGGELRGKRFLDVGCGSGLAMLAALRLGAASVTGVDLDPDSAVAARVLLTEWAQGADWNVRVQSVFDLDPTHDGTYDAVHSWGVLHHTGDMWRAVEKVAALVTAEGHLAVALYRSTPLCPFWKREKRFYAFAPSAFQAVIRTLYEAIYIAGLIATRRNPIHYITHYRTDRGMSWHHNVHDWLGGYPYESTDPPAVLAFLQQLGFSAVRVFERPAAVAGLLGTHCDEYVVVRRR